MIRLLELLNCLQGLMFIGVIYRSLWELMDVLFMQKTPLIRKEFFLENLITNAQYSTQELQCRGCENHCVINKYSFENNNIFYSGNKCEKIFTNDGDKKLKGKNIYTDKYNLLFKRKSIKEYNYPIVVGIPRALNIYENYPFWHELFASCGICTVLSEPSTFKNYESGVSSVMSDNICFPAKLTHSHIYDLISKKLIEYLCLT